MSGSSGLSINASSATIAAAAFCAACSPNIGRNSSSYVAREPRIRSAWPPVAWSRSSTSKSRYSSNSVAPISSHRASITVQGIGVLLAAHHDGALLDDARLLARHLGDRRTQLRVVERDRRQHGDVATDQVRRVPCPAHPHLEHPERHRLVREPQVRERAQRLEVRDLLLALGVHQHQERQQVLVLLGELLLRDVDPAHREPLADGHEVRRRVQARREPVRTREFGRHARGGPLAVRAGDVDRRIRQLRVGEQRREREDPRQVGHHAALTASLELGDGFPEVQRDQPPARRAAPRSRRAAA